MDRIWVSDMRFWARHGVLREEDKNPQLFSVDVEVWLDAGDAARTGRVDRTVDYRACWQAARDVLEGRSERLLETLAHRVADAVLKPPARRVTVRVRKLSPPLLGPAREVGAEVSLE